MYEKIREQGVDIQTNTLSQINGLKRRSRCLGRQLIFLIIVSLLSVVSALASAASRSSYHVEYNVTLVPETRSANVQIVLGKRAQYVRWVRLTIDPNYHTGFTGSGRIKQEGKSLLWYPGAKTGSLSFNVNINHQRPSGGYDALFSDKWALFRGDDIIPPARVRMKGGTQAKATLQFQLPKGWSVVTSYSRYKSGAYKIDHTYRLFDRPTGWILAGKLGVKRETIAGVSVAVAAPKGHGVRRMDILALLNWNMQELTNVFLDFPSRLLIVSAADPMWRGALSGPVSLYIHADRPLISEDGTSPLLHELVHVAMSARSASGADWLVEGIAEYYSLEIMRRSGTITEKRYQKSLERLAKRGASVTKLDVEHSYGDTTAKAVGIVKALDTELRDNSNNRITFDDIVRELATRPGNITVDLVRSIGKKLSGVELKWNPDVKT